MEFEGDFGQMCARKQREFFFGVIDGTCAIGTRQMRGAIRCAAAAGVHQIGLAVWQTDQHHAVV